MMSLADLLDALNRRIGLALRWLCLFLVLVQFVAVLLRYVFGVSFIWLNETVLYMHACLFMLAAGYTLLVDGHVRVDVFQSRASARGKTLIDIFGHLVFLFPAMGALLWFSWPSVAASWAVREGAISVGGIPASFLLKTLIPLFCALLILQGIARLIRDVLRLRE